MQDWNKRVAEAPVKLPALARSLALNSHCCHC